MTVKPTPDIADVRAFWDANPLWTGEASTDIGTKDFFEEHRGVYYRDCFAGKLDERIFPNIDRSSSVLDLGCGIGFWLVEFWQRGFHNLSGADLSPRSLEIARRRCAVYGIGAELSVRNAEATGFDAQSFDHINCQGVIHHTPDPPAAVQEIFRMLRPGGTASISVYYRNMLLTNWHALRPAAKIAAQLGGGMKGRGREDIMAIDDIDDIVRRYDGDKNPIGKAYGLSQFKTLIGPEFKVEETYFHFFPARALPFKIPGVVHRQLDRWVPFMIYANLRKP